MTKCSKNLVGDHGPPLATPLLGTTAIWQELINNNCCLMAACEGMLISRKPGKVMNRSTHVKLRLFVIQPAGTLYRLEAVAAGSLPVGCRGRAPSWCRRSDSVPSKQARRRKPAQKDVQSKPGDRLKYKKRDYERLNVCSFICKVTTA